MTSIDTNNITNAEDESLKRGWRAMEGYFIPALIGIDVTATHLGYGIPIAEALLIGSIVTIPLTLILLMLQKSKKSIFYSQHKPITLLMLFGMIFVCQSLDNSGVFLKKANEFNLVYTQIICGSIFADLSNVGVYLLSKLFKKIEK